MPNRTCSLDGCGKPHRARGLCASHYAQQHMPDRHRRDITCEICGARSTTTRSGSRFCSLLCRDIHRGARMAWPLPRRHPVMLILNPPQPRPTPEPRVELHLECAWCGTAFVTMKASQRMCSKRCLAKASRVRRRGQAAGSTSHYTWTEVMRLFLSFGRRCAYCERPINGQPDPDHVVPLSKGGSNSITNILPCCSACNSDKRDLLLDEWAADRERRGLVPRVTEWSLTDPRIQHLTSLKPAA